MCMDNISLSSIVSLRRFFPLPVDVVVVVVVVGEDFNKLFDNV